MKQCSQLTVIVPVYNRNEKLRRALESIAHQTAAPHEVIVVDDASSERIEVPSDIQKNLNVRLVRRPTNGGAAAARNTGLLLAKTDWVAFLDSDDVWLPQSLDVRWSLVEQHIRSQPDEKTIYACAWLDRDTEGRPLRVRRPREARLAIDFAGGCWFSPGSCVILNRVRAIEAAGLQDESLRRFEDFDWFLSLAMSGFRLIVLPVVGVGIEIDRKHADQSVVRRNCELLRRKWMAVPGVDFSMRRRILSYIDLEMASAFYHHRSWFRMMAPLARSMLRAPRLSVHVSPGWQIGEPDNTQLP
jgi:glycosyltransferase involved in cell wall biosynthesis